jgi:hypothetical protein
MYFKQIIFVALLSLFTILSCKKEEKYQSTALVTGPDLRECICCGGYFIEIKDSTYNFDTIPASSGIDLSDVTFPVAVKLDWQHDRKCGDIRYINITRIKRQ